MDARCQCGQISFTVPANEPSKIFFCHCKECQHQSSSAFGIAFIFPQLDLPLQTWLDNEEMKSYTRKADSGRTIDCYFCTRCGSRVLHKGRETGVANVRGGCFDAKVDLSKAIHVWTKRAVVPIPKEAERYEEGPQ